LIKNILDVLDPLASALPATLNAQAILQHLIVEQR
jgi:hypothetical protein